MKSLNVLFTSRHQLTQEQCDDLDRLFTGFELNLKTQNVTYATKGGNAYKQLALLCKDENIDVLIGVFPAHIAANIAVTNTYDYGELRVFDGVNQKTIVLAPVSEAVFAEEDGKPRGFRHSHFEVIAGFDILSRIGADPYKFV
jgi:hypothetical protein